MNNDAAINGNLEPPLPSSRPIPVGAEFQAGAIVGNTYEIVDYLGRGAMGFVYRARHLVLPREYALKTLGADQVSDTAWRRFQNEAQAIAKMSHPNVVGIHNFGLHRAQDGFDIPFYVMDLLNGGNLAERLRDKGSVPLLEALRLYQQAAAGLGYAHSKGIIHRDVKPGNIVLLSQPDSTGAILKIVDFGIAKLTDNELYTQRLTTAGEVFGSPFYMSPEQSMAQKLDARTDIYSLGISFFETLSGVLPFSAKSAVEIMIKHQNEPVPDINAVTGQNFPADLQTVLEIMMAKNPDDRYQSMEQVIADLFSLEQGEAPEFNTEAVEQHLDQFGFRQAFSESGEDHFSATGQNSFFATTGSQKLPSENEFEEQTESKVLFKPLLLAAAALVFVTPIFIYFLSRGGDSSEKASTVIGTSVTKELAAPINDAQAGQEAIVADQGPAIDVIPSVDSWKSGKQIDSKIVDPKSEAAAAPIKENYAKGSALNESKELIEDGIGELNVVFSHTENALKAYGGEQNVSRKSQTDTAKFSTIEKIDGIRYRSFKFPTDIFIGTIHSIALRMQKNAQGSWKVPADARLGFCPSLTVASYPQYLKRFQEGDIYSVYVLSTACSDKLLSALPEIPGVAELSLKKCKTLSPACYTSFSKFKHLRLLDLSGNTLDGATLAKAKCIDALEKLFWSQAVNPNPVLRRLQGSSNLIGLSIENSRLTHKDYEAISLIPKLRILSLSKNRVTLDDLKSLASLSNLRYLNVQECGLNLESIPILKKFPSLRELKILSSGTPDRMRDALVKELSTVSIH